MTHTKGMPHRRKGTFTITELKYLQICNKILDGFRIFFCCGITIRIIYMQGESDIDRTIRNRHVLMWLADIFHQHDQFSEGD